MQTQPTPPAKRGLGRRPQQAASLNEDAFKGGADIPRSRGLNLRRPWRLDIGRRIDREEREPN